MNIRYILITICLLCHIQVQAQKDFQANYNDFANDEQLAHAAIGFYAMDANTGEFLASSDEQLNLNPASILKLMTTGAALDILGSDYRFHTKLYYEGELHGDSLQGNIIIKAGGDPALGSKYFTNYTPYQNFVSRWAKAIKGAGIRYVSGSIIVDTSIYDEQSIPNTWLWEDMGNYYGAGVNALSVYDNTCTIHFSSPASADMPTQVIKVTPHVPNMEIKNLVLSSNINKDQAYVFGSPFDSYRVVRGTIPRGRSDFKVKASMPQPSNVLVYELKEKLAASGIRLAEGKLTASNKLHLLDDIPSPVLEDIVRVTNHESVNLFAEHLVKQLAYEKNGKGTFDDGLDVLTSYWEERGIDFSNIADGSGLSKFNVVRADQMCELLYQIAQNKKITTSFYQSLPSVPNGTLWYFNHSLFPNKSLRVKSGSMTGVRSFAGKLRCNDGREMLFVIIANNFDCSQSRLIKKIERMLYYMKN